MPTYRTPDVYVEEISLFPPSVAEVGTAIPAFIGYTEKGPVDPAGNPDPRPVKVRAMTDYEDQFGGPKAEPIAVGVTEAVVAGKKQYTVASVTDPPSVAYLMYWSVKLYFDNGGGECYIVSVGRYTDAAGGPAAAGSVDARIDKAKLIAGLDKVRLEDEPTLLVIPEATRLAANDYRDVVQAMLKQCGDLRDRFAIFDLFNGQGDLAGAGLSDSRDKFGTNALKYGAAYYPFVRTTFSHFVAKDANQVEGANVNVTIAAAAALPPPPPPAPAPGPAPAPAPAPAAAVTLASLVSSNTSAFNLVRSALGLRYVVLPPSGALAGVYAATDASRGVWKAPANVSLADVIEPVVRLDSDRQGEFNVDATTGKSVNAIRAFAGKGTLVWGARTLAGNDNEWRYISVRRFFNMVEESVKKSTYWAVFEPNDANTWVKVRGMIESYLTDKWREGALAGATPKDAFYVRCGLGTTMNSQDILEGRMNVEIGMAVVRPAEFVILKFSHKMQVS